MGLLKGLPTLRAKLLLAFLGLCCFLTVFIASFVYINIRHSHMEAVRYHLSQLAVLVAMQVDGDRLDRLTDKTQQTSADYLAIRGVLVRIMEQEPNIKDVYTMRKVSAQGTYAFIVDAEPDPQDAASIGELYDGRPAPAIEQGFTEPSADREFVTDKWGITLSGYAPVRNSAGKVVAVLGVDMDASLIEASLTQYRNRFMGYAAIALVVASVTSVFLARHVADRIKEIDHVVTKMSGGELDVALAVDGSDEISRLRGSINNLAASINNERETMLLATIKAFVQALDAKDAYTGSHSLQVAEIATTIAREAGLTGEKLFAVNFAAILHDIGKIGIPDNILNKTYPLNAAEWELIRQHSEVGAKIVAEIPNLAEVATIIRYHHARPDGRGYPALAAGEEIPLGSRIIAIADSFQAMTSDRVYKNKKTVEEALAEIKNCRGSQFDPDLTDIFLRLNKYI